MYDKIVLTLTSTALVAFAGSATAPFDQVPTAKPATTILAVQDTKGTITGIVKYSDGVPAADLDVYLYEISMKREGQGGGGPTQAQLAAALQQGDGVDRRYGKPVGRTKTEKDGTFKISRPVKGTTTYKVIVGTRGGGGPYAARSATVKAGEEVKLDISLQVASSGTGKAGGGSNGDDGRRR